MTDPQKKAAWLTSPKEKPFKVSDAPFPFPDVGEVSIKNEAVAINPVDRKIQELGILIQKYPNILGCDFAGVVEDVGEGVTRFKKGRRVIRTATAALYMSEHLALPLPTVSLPPPPPQSGVKKQTIFIWGGASSVGSIAIQLAKASGLHVLTTASARNAAYVRSLGADVLLDYAGADVEGAATTAIQKARRLLAPSTPSPAPTP